MTYSTFSKRPLMLVTISMLIGLVIDMMLSLNLQLPILVIAASAWVICHFRRTDFIQIFSWMISFALLGMFLSRLHQYSEVTPSELNDIDHVGVFVEHIKSKNGFIYITGSAMSGKIKARLLIRYRDSCHLSISEGSYIQLNARLWVPNHAKDLDAFDYNKYLRTKNIQFISYAKCHEMFLLESGSVGFSSVARSINGSLLNQIDRIFKKTTSIALVKGILLGCKDDMDTDQKELFSLAGVGHVFAVSGMHVGMVFLLCWPILWFRNRHVVLKFALPILVICLVWLFVMASGMTPSAIRAGTMISFYEFGKLLNRKIDKWNILSITALIAVCLDPHIIKDIGFQFSYLALVGIFFFYSILNRFVKYNNQLLNLLSNMIILSFSAQLALLPLSLYYFGNFSPYFWLNSLIAMLIVQLNFILSFAALFMDMLGMPANFLVFWIDELFIFLSNSIAVIMTLPGAILKWKPSMGQVLFGYQLIICLGLYMSSSDRLKMLNKIFYFLSITLAVLCLKDLGPNRQKYVVLSFNQTFEIVIDSDLGTKKLDCSDLFRDGQIARIGSRSFQLLQEDSQSNTINSEVLIVNKKEVHLANLMLTGELKYIIVADRITSKSRYELKRWCHKSNVQFYELSNGYLKLKL